MIPFYAFLLAWLVFIALYGVMSLISIIQMLRFGIAVSGTWLSTITFLVVAFVVILGTGWYLLGIDWQQALNAFGWLESISFFPE